MKFSELPILTGNEVPLHQSWQAGGLIVGQTPDGRPVVDLGYPHAGAYRSQKIVECNAIPPGEMLDGWVEDGVRVLVTKRRGARPNLVGVDN